MHGWCLHWIMMGRVAKKKSAALLHLQQVGMGAKPTEHPASMQVLNVAERAAENHPAEDHAARAAPAGMASLMFCSPKTG